MLISDEIELEHVKKRLDLQESFTEYYQDLVQKYHKIFRRLEEEIEQLNNKIRELEGNK